MTLSFLKNYKLLLQRPTLRHYLVFKEQAQPLSSYLLQVAWERVSNFIVEAFNSFPVRQRISVYTFHFKLCQQLIEKK